MLNSTNLPRLFYLQYRDAMDYRVPEWESLSLKEQAVWERFANQYESIFTDIRRLLYKLKDDVDDEFNNFEDFHDGPTITYEEVQALSGPIGDLVDMTISDILAYRDGEG